MILVRVAHFEIIAEHIVVANLQRRDACLSGFALLYLQEVVLAAVGDVAQFVEFRIHAVADDTAFVDELWWVVGHFAGNAVAHLLAELQPFAHLADGFVVAFHTGLLHGYQSHQGGLQLVHLAGSHPSDGHFRTDTLQVAHKGKLRVHQFAEQGFAEEMLGHIQSAVDGLLFLQGEHHPSLQHACPHWRHGAVEHIEQRPSALLHGIEQFQRTHGELVQAHVLILLDSAERGDVTNLCVLRVL